MVFEDTKPKRHYGRFLLAAFVAGLAFVPFDLAPTIFLWMGGFAAAFWSVIQLMSAGIKLLAGDKLHWPTAIFAPLLTIVCLPLAMVAMRFSFHVAEKFSSKTADAIQAECQFSDCPVTVAGWKKGALRCASSARSGFFTHYYICYERSQDGRSFNLWLTRNIDSSVLWSGGKGVRLQKQSIDD